MNEQLASSIRSILIGIGGFVVGKGWIDQSTMMTLVGIFMSAIPAILSFWAHRQAGIIAAASALPDVHAIVTTPAIAEGTFLLDPKVVTAPQVLMSMSSSGDMK